MDIIQRVFSRTDRFQMSSTCSSLFDKYAIGQNHMANNLKKRCSCTERFKSSQQILNAWKTSFNDIRPSMHKNNEISMLLSKLQNVQFSIALSQFSIAFRASSTFLLINLDTRVNGLIVYSWSISCVAGAC